MELNLSRLKDKKEDTCRAIYRVTHSFYKTKRGYVNKVDLYKMKSLSFGFDLLEEEEMNCGEGVNLDFTNTISGKLYKVVCEDYSQCPWNGDVDYSIKLIPYKEPM